VTKCILCEDEGWVCEKEPRPTMDRPARLQLRRRWCALPSLQRSHCRQTAATAEGI
jgi:hypothetical protein